MFSASTIASISRVARDFFSFSGVQGIKAFLFVLLGALVEGVGIVLLVPFIAVVVGAGEAGGWVQRLSSALFALFSVESRLARVSLLVFLFATLMVARAVIISIRDVTSYRLEVGFVQRIRSRIAHDLAAASWETVSRLRHSRVVQLMGGEIYDVAVVTRMLMRDLAALVMLVSQVALAFLLSPVFAALAFGLVLAGAITVLPLARRAKAFGTYVIDANLMRIDDIGQFLGGLKLAISQNLQGNFVHEFDVALAALSAEEVRYVRRSTAARLAIVTSSGIVGALALLFSIAIVDVPPSVLVALLLMLSRMNGPVMQLQDDVQQFARSVPVFDKIESLQRDLAVHRLGPAPQSYPDGLTNGAIVFADVSYLHTGEGDVQPNERGGVTKLDLVIEQGSILGVTGPSGAGKTTFADLVVGLYPPRGGTIRIGRTALEGETLGAWRNRISYVVQDPFLFNDTIRRNLLWAKPDAGESELWDALEVVGAAEIARRTAKGLDAVVGERGMLLSGGERQRLCLARGLLRKPRLIVLDEATNAIDVESERAILERVKQLNPRPTIIVIAHRSESLRNCERIIVLERGKLVHDGSGDARLDSVIAGWPETVHA